MKNCASFSTNANSSKNNKLIERPRIEEPDVAAAIILLLFENSNEPLFKAFVPGCKKNGKFSNIRVMRASISRAVAPLLASTATVFSE